HYNACSLHQLDRYGRAFPERAAIIRVNPGLGSGSTKRTNTGGPASSFGIWHAYLDEAKTLAARHRLVIRGLHTHIGSGSDPAVWTRVAGLVLEIAARLPDVTTVSLGGGFKVARVPGEQATDLVAVGSVVREAFVDFHRRTGRKLRLEIEPGAYLVANGGAVVATCVDVVDTGEDGYLFAKLDAGMTEVTRPSLYGAPLDHLAERLQRPHPHHVPGRLGLEHHLLLGERVEAHARFGGRLPLDRDPHQAGDLEHAGAVLREVRLDHVRHGVKDGRDVS